MPWLELRFVSTVRFFKLAAELLVGFSYFLYFVPGVILNLTFLVEPTMSLENLRFGSFRPTTVAVEARALPGFGGEVHEWANYKFAVEALQLKEEHLNEGERKKLGPLGLRLSERLAGPALQVAKKLGLTTLAKADGAKQLLEALEEQLLPLRKQAALELYQAGMRDGILSRQTGESMASYCLRREA